MKEVFLDEKYMLDVYEKIICQEGSTITLSDSMEMLRWCVEASTPRWQGTPQPLSQKGTGHQPIHELLVSLTRHIGFCSQHCYQQQK